MHVAREREALRILEAERAESAYRVARGILLAQQVNQQDAAQAQAQAQAQERQREEQRQSDQRRNYYLERLERAQLPQADARAEFQRLMEK